MKIARQSRKETLNVPKSGFSSTIINLKVKNVTLPDIFKDSIFLQFVVFGLIICHTLKYKYILILSLFLVKVVIDEVVIVVIVIVIVFVVVIVIAVVAKVAVVAAVAEVVGQVEVVVFVVFRLSTQISIQ
jgi:hypothetical protein